MGLRSEALSGFLWSSAGTLGNGLVSFIVTIILARLLTPADFALVALLNVFIAVSNVLVDSGFSQAIIRDDNPSNKDLTSVFIFNMALSIALYLILFLLSPNIAKFYQSPEMTALSRVVFLVIIFNASTIIQYACLKRNLEFKKVEKATVLGTLIAGVFSVTMAFTGFGIWSLVANMVLMPFFRSVVLWVVSKWRPTGRFNIGSIKKYFNFGFFLTIHGLVDVIVTNLTTLCIGKVYTKDELGYYSQASKLDAYITSPFSAVLNKVIYPIFVKVKDDSLKLKHGYREMVGMVLYVILPCMLFISFNADDTMALIFGEKWRPSGIYLEILAILCLFQIIHQVFTNAILIEGKTNIMLIFTLIKQGLRILSLILTINISVRATVLGYVISGVIGSSLYIGLGMYYLKYSLKELIIDNYKTILATAIALFVVYLIGSLNVLNSIIIFIFQIIIMFFAYLTINILFKNNYHKEILSMIQSYVKR